MHISFPRLTQQTLKNATSEKVFDRGLSYFRNGHVKKIWLEDNILYAIVLGNYDDYLVKIEDDNGHFAYHCTCPYEGNCCKHVVAAGLAFLQQKKKIVANAQKTTDDQDNLKNQLLHLSQEDLADLIILSFKTHRHWKDTLLKEAAKRLEQKGKGNINNLYQKQFLTLFNRISAILEKHNQYGGGEEEEEDEAYEALDDIVQLFRENKLDKSLKQDFIDKMFYYYDWGNSGMNDMVWQAVHDICDTRDDWLYVIDKLQKKDDDYRKSLIIQIYKDKLHDEEEYLRLRQQDLRYGTDYYDLVLFYINKENLEKAVEIAKLGIHKGEGRITDLLEFLFEQYKKTNYDEALTYIKKLFAEEAGFHRYKQLRQFAHPEDWKLLDLWCLTILKKQSKHDQLAHIYMDNKEYDNILGYILEKPAYDIHGYDFSEKETFAKKLIPIYPDKLLPYYEQKMNKCIGQMGRDNYKKAADYVKIIKEIYLKHLHQDNEWNAFIERIRKTYEKRPALLQELRGL